MKYKLKYKKDKDVEKIHEELEKELDIKVVSRGAGGTVNGYVNTHIEGEDRVVELFFYDEDKPANFEIYEYNGVTYSRGNKTNIVTKKPKEKGWEKLTGKLVI